MKNYPKIYKIKELENWDVLKSNDDGVWIPARPLHYSINIFKRLKIAYKVFIGEYDALSWERK